MSHSLVTIFYILAAVLFILSLGGLSNQETARRGNMFGMIGMLLAFIAVTASDTVTSYTILDIALFPTIIIGATDARKVK